LLPKHQTSKISLKTSEVVTLSVTCRCQISAQYRVARIFSQLMAKILTKNGCFFKGSVYFAATIIASAKPTATAWLEL